MSDPSVKRALERAVRTLKVHSLKLVLAEFRLRRSGNKPELIERVLNYAQRTGMYEVILNKVNNPYQSLNGEIDSAYAEATVRHPQKGSNSSEAINRLVELPGQAGAGAAHVWQQQQQPDAGAGGGPRSEDAALLKKAADQLRTVAESDPFLELVQVLHEVSLLDPKPHLPLSLLLNMNHVPRDKLLRPDVQVLVYCVCVVKGRKELEQDRKTVNAGKHVAAEDPWMKWPAAVSVRTRMGEAKIVQQSPDGRLRTKAVRERPADITKLISSGSQKTNLRVAFPHCEQHDEGSRFAISVVISRKRTTDEILATIPSDSWERSLELVADVFGDGEIEMGLVSVNMRDLVTFMPIEIPVRGSACTHVQCFDARGFLEFQRSARNAQFRCPVCNKAPLYPHRLVKDPWFAEIVRKMSASRDSTDKVEYFRDGQWRPCVEPGPGASSAAPDASSVSGAQKRRGSELESIRKRPQPDYYAHDLESLSPPGGAPLSAPGVSVPTLQTDEDGAIVLLDSDDEA